MDFFTIKQELIDELWLPFAIEGSKKLYPLRIKNKKMKLFTLTDRECKEIKSFKKNDLIKTEFVYAWSAAQHDVYRLESELGNATILDEGKFEDIIVGDPQTIFNCLPCDIINLDFSSQKPLKFNGRIEKELYALNITIEYLSQQATNKYMLIYTTPLNGHDVKVSDISFNYMKPDSLHDTIIDIHEKEIFLTDIIESVACNNNYNEFSTKTITKQIPNSSDIIFSFVGVFYRS